ncbi:hypothetical protein D9619_011161 [Psilocybe cf. subviscida]|uniref:NACHT domain-containing protein n=1 Tax=Psilocybe cf. subviscida TaxID=2480587 RepID=A0A8H5BJ76_9AGAR|nr:hypothetical protein D9619_011161 [Psilocybe cf. subviscida]
MPKKRAKAKRSNLPTTAQSAAAMPPTSSSAADMPSMFNNAQIANITGGSFSITTNVNTGNDPSLDVLHKRVAPNAIINAGGRAEDVRCHPGTREEVISRIEKWGNTQDGPTEPIFWFSGPAGAGKTAIVQTIAERCEQRGVPHANFFFFRADTSRSNAYPLMATLLHQIILLYPSLRGPMANILTINPLIFDSVLENQLVQLIVIPLRAIQLLSSAYRPLVLLVDGLDECDSESKRSQQQILRAFDTVMAEHPRLFCLLVASRDESQIRAAFNRISSPCLQLFLDDQYSPASDIRLFVNARFEQVRNSHPLAHTLDAIWPTVEDVNYIVEKSSGQFIYAATVMRFILDSSASPIVSLQRVQGAARLATKSPFSYLDSIYSYILSQADDQEALKDIFHAQLLITRSSPDPTSLADPPLMELLRGFNPRYTKEMVLSCLADLTPIVSLSSNSRKLKFYHASFPDYLLDRSRAREYFVDTVAFNYKILPVVWNLMENHEYPEIWRKFGFTCSRQLQELPPGWMNVLLSLKHSQSDTYWRDSDSILQTIYNLCTCDDDINNLKRIMRKWINSYSVKGVVLANIEHLPFTHRHFYMARGDHDFRMPPDSEMLAALHPETDYDRHELGPWLSNLLHLIHRKVYIFSSGMDLDIATELSNRFNQQQYTTLLEAWISWAVANDIPCDGLEDLPDAQEYIRWRTTEKLTRHSEFCGGEN